MFDYWNHPLIVKAMRSKYRGGRMYTLATVYLSVLLLGGMFAFHYREQMGPQWLRIYLVCVFSVQFFLSALVAIMSTVMSMAAEVTTRTLDFQRITSLSPRQILLGKVFGEPASSYLLAIATVPIAILCCNLGAASLPIVAMLYVTLGTTTFMAACIGVQNSLEPASPGQPSSGQSAAGGFIGLVIFVIPWSIQAAAGNFGDLGTALIGILTPVMTLKGLTRGDAWAEQMPFFQSAIPYALVTPVAQTGLALFALQCMTRRLTHPLNTAASKLQAYTTAGVCGLLWASFVYREAGFGAGLVSPIVAFAIGYTMLAFVLVLLVTPKKETFESWIWRLRGRRHWLADAVMGERFLNTVPAIILCLVGGLLFAVAIALPATVSNEAILAQTDWPTFAGVILAAVLILLSYATFHQWTSVTVTKGALAFLFFLVVTLNLGPYLLGAYYDVDLLKATSIVAVFAKLADNPATAYGFAPLLLVHAALLLVSAFGLLTVSRRMIVGVERKLVAIRSTA